MSRFVLGPPPPRPAPPIEIEYVAWFRFPVAWTYLGNTLQDVRPELPIHPVTSGLAPEPAIRTLASTEPAPAEPAPPQLDRTLISAPPRPTALSGDTNKIVMPQLIRPPVGPPVERPPAPSPPPVSAEPASAKDAAPIEYVEPPILQFASEETFLARFGPQVALAA